MTYSNELIEVVFDSIFFVLPVVGATIWLLNYLARQIKHLKKLNYSESTGKKIRKRIKILSVVSTLMLFLCFFLIWWHYFPSVNIPRIFRLIELILYLVFFGCLGVLYGLGKAVAAGAGSATGILNRLFDMISDKNDFPNPDSNKSTNQN